MFGAQSGRAERGREREREGEREECISLSSRFPFFSHIQKIPVLAEIRDAKAKKEEKKETAQMQATTTAVSIQAKRSFKEQCCVVMSELHVLVSMCSCV